MSNCNVYGLVDFGDGPVEVRCTETKPHVDHICKVFLATEGQKIEEKSPVGEFDAVEGTHVNHRNVFEDGGDSQDLHAV